MHCSHRPHQSAGLAGSEVGWCNPLRALRLASCCPTSLSQCVFLLPFVAALLLEFSLLTSPMYVCIPCKITLYIPEI